MAWHLGLVENTVDNAFLADFLNVAERLFFDRRQTAGDVTLRRLRVGKISCLVALDHVLVVIENAHEVTANFLVAAARRHKHLVNVNEVVAVQWMEALTIEVPAAFVTTETRLPAAQEPRS